MVFAVALALVLLFSAPAAAEPISLFLITATLGAEFAVAGGWLAWSVTTALTIGASIGLSALAQALAKKPSGADTTFGGAQSTLQVGGDIPRQCAFGRVASKGQLVYWNTYDVNNNALQLVFVLSEGWCDGLERVWINGEAKALIPWEGFANTFYVEGYNNFLEVRFVDGRPGQQAESTLVNHANPPDRWTAADKLTGLTYVSVLLAYDQATYPNGIPEFLWEFRGLRLYDWRKDSTIGGSGTHRFEAPWTWEWTDNAAVILYNYQRGIFLNSQLVLGQGVQVYDLLHDHYTAAANICDEQVTLGVGGTEKRYACSLIAPANAQHWRTIESIIHAMSGYMLERTGAFAPIAGAAQVPVATITDDDLVVGSDVQFAGKRSRTDLINAMFGQFTDPAQSWEPNSYPPLIHTNLEFEDGGERLPTNYDLLMISSVTQAQRVARSRLRELRHQATGSITAAFKYVYLEAGDWITWDSALYGSRLCRIASRTINQDKTIALQLGEVGNDIYSWNAGDENPILLPPTIPIPGYLLTTISGFQVVASVFVGSDAQYRPALLCLWTPPGDAQIDAVIFEYRILNDPAALRVSTTDVQSGKFYITDNILPGTTYEVRATISTTPFRITTFTPWYIVTAANQFSLPNDIVRMEMLQAEIRKIIDTVAGIGRDTLAQRIAELKAEMENRGEHFAQAVVQTNIIVAKEGDNRQAAILSEQTVRADAIEVVARDLESLSTVVDDDSSAVTILAESVDGIEAQYAVTIEINNVTGGFVLKGAKKLDGSVEIILGVKGDVIVDGTIAGTKLVSHSIITQEAQLNNAVVGTIRMQDGAVTVPVSAYNAQGFEGSGPMLVLTLITTNLVFQAPAGMIVRVFAMYNSQHIKTIATPPYAVWIMHINNNEVSRVEKPPSVDPGFITFFGTWDVLASGGVQSIPISVFYWGYNGLNTYAHRIFAQITKR